MILLPFLSLFCVILNRWWYFALLFHLKMSITKFIIFIDCNVFSKYWIRQCRIDNTLFLLILDEKKRMIEVPKPLQTTYWMGFMRPTTKWSYWMSMMSLLQPLFHKHGEYNVNGLKNDKKRWAIFNWLRSKEVTSYSFKKRIVTFVKKDINGERSGMAKASGAWGHHIVRESQFC